jgi:twinkle protein
MPRMEGSEFVAHLPCPCGKSSDGLATYTDGHGHCFPCGKHFPSLEDGPPRPQQEKKITNLLDGAPRALTARGLTEETCSRMGYWVGSMGGKAVQIANYYAADGVTRVAQKVRDANKGFSFIGEPKQATLFGQQLWRNGGRRVYITEGEIDALTVFQVTGHKWPVVSVPNGAQGAAKSLAAQLPWLNLFEQVVLVFDNDEAGRSAIEACVKLFPPGKAYVVSLPADIKDPSEMLQAGRAPELVTRLWEATAYRPDGIVGISDVEEAVMADIAKGLPWFLPAVDALSYGRRTGEVIALGAGTGVGKTDIITEQIAFDLTVLKQPVAVFALEQMPAETVKRIAGKVASQRFHVPDGSWTKGQLQQAMDTLKQGGQLFLYDNFGATDWAIIRERIRFLAHTEGVKLFYLDHLTALAAAAPDERIELEKIMAEIGALVKELNIWLLFVSHLATPDGKPHEEGGRVTIRHFKGSRAIGFWSHFIVGLERDQQADNEDDRHTTVLRILKDRLTGQATGKTISLGYDPSTGRVSEATRTPFEAETGF